MPTVTAGELRRRIQSLGGDASRTFIEDTDVYDWIMDAQQQISKITECLTTTTTISSVAGQEFYSPANAVIRPLRVLYDGNNLKSSTVQHIDQIDPTHSATGIPSLFYMDGGQIGLWPVPSTAVTNGISLRARVLSTGTINDDNDVIEIPDYFKEDIVRYCMLKMREKDEQPETMQVLFQDWTHKIAVSKNIVDSPEADSYPVVRDSESMYDYAIDWYSA